MAYKSDRVGVLQMFDELVAAGWTRHAAAAELGAALEDGAIELCFAGTLVVEEIGSIVRTLRELAADPCHRPVGMGAARYTVILSDTKTADRQKFEIAFGFTKPAQQPRLTAEEACKAFILRLKEEPRLTSPTSAL
jgi:hypothetical protein